MFGSGGVQLFRRMAGARQCRTGPIDACRSDQNTSRSRQEAARSSRSKASLSR